MIAVAFTGAESQSHLRIVKHGGHLKREYRGLRSPRIPAYTPIPTLTPMNAPQTAPRKSSCFGTGCLLLLLLVVVAGGVVWWKYGSQMTQWARDYQQDPERATALGIIEIHPELERISVDEPNRTVTFKIKSSGEVVTATFKALLASKIVTVNGQTHIENLEGGPAAGAAPPASEPPPAAQQR
jgi:hypothetical protein